MRRRLIQAVLHSDNIFTNFEQHWNILKIEADEEFSRRQLIWRAKSKFNWCVPTGNNTVPIYNIFQKKTKTKTLVHNVLFNKYKE